MINIIASSAPKQFSDLHVFVEKDGLIIWLTKPAQGDEFTSLFYPMPTIEECLAMANRSLEDPELSTISPESVKLLSEDDKTKIISFMLKNKQAIDERIEDFKKMTD